MPPEAHIELPADVHQRLVRYVERRWDIDACMQWAPGAPRIFVQDVAPLPGGAYLVAIVTPCDHENWGAYNPTATPLFIDGRRIRDATFNATPDLLRDAGVDGACFHCALEAWRDGSVHAWTGVTDGGAGRIGTFTRWRWVDRAFEFELRVVSDLGAHMLLDDFGEPAVVEPMDARCTAGLALLPEPPGTLRLTARAGPREAHHDIRIADTDCSHEPHGPSTRCGTPEDPVEYDAVSRDDDWVVLRVTPDSTAEVFRTRMGCSLYVGDPALRGTD
ncbi:MAG: hypothetical protein R3B40_28705 [Polyangiales bacterium]